ncbi:MAG: DUF177 domain-containing protein [Muribaculaceae bacterium]|nr:DUF177 domain-containing protein [Muribaculaceae bacterium]
MGKFSQYKVHLASLADGKYEQDFECGTDFFKNMENPDVISSDVHVHLNLIKKNDAYDFTFTCKGMLQVPCDRCLDPIDLDVDTTYHITVKYGADYNDETDDLLIIPESDTYINVAYMLHDTIVLTIPLRHVHPLGKCNRAMAAALHKHRSNAGDDIDEALDEVDDEIAGEINTDE